MAEILIHDLELSPRVVNALERVGVVSLRRLGSLDDAGLLATRGIGRKSLAEIKAELVAIGWKGRQRRWRPSAKHLS